MFKQAAVLIMIAFLLGGANVALNPKKVPVSPDVLAEGEISMQDALALAAGEGLYWLDARERSKYEAEHIPGAYLLNEDEWEDLLIQFLEIWDGEKHIVVYCNGGGCQASHDVALRLKEDLGTDAISVLHNGWSAWEEVKDKQ